MSPKAAERYFAEFLPRLLTSASGTGVDPNNLQEFARKAHADVMAEVSEEDHCYDEMLFTQATENSSIPENRTGRQIRAADLDRIQKHESEIRRLKIQLRNAPSEEELNRLKSEFSIASKEEIQSHAAWKRKDEELSLLQEERTKITEALEQRARDASEQDLSLEKQQRTLDSVKATKARISEFQAVLLADNLKVIEGHIEDRCSQLSAKSLGGQVPHQLRDLRPEAAGRSKRRSRVR